MEYQKKCLRMEYQKNCFFRPFRKENHACVKKRTHVFQVNSIDFSKHEYVNCVIVRARKMEEGRNKKIAQNKKNLAFSFYPPSPPVHPRRELDFSGTNSARGVVSGKHYEKKSAIKSEFRGAKRL